VLKPGQSAPQGTTATEPVKTTDMSAYFYDKGRKKENLRVHELHVVPDPLTDAKYEVEQRAE